MKRFLLFMVMIVCVSVGVQVNATTTIGNTTWCQYNDYADEEKVLTIFVDTPGELATAINSQDFSNYQILHISASTRGHLLTLSEADLEALANVDVATIEMMRAYVEPFVITNSNMKRIILPYSWTKEQVKAFGEANSTSAKFESCISMNDQDKYDSRKGDAALIAYLNKANTLKDAIMRTWNDTHGYAPLGDIVYNGGGDCTRLKYLTVMGNFSARDISSKGNYDADGHYVINGISDENTQEWNKNTEGGDLYTTPEGNNGALASCGELFVIDLKDGYVPDEYATDIVVGYNGIGNTHLREVWMPEDPRFKTVPADYLNVNGSVRQICIPGNIEYIRARAFASNSGTGRLCYVWTTGSDPKGKYDNGAAFVSGGETTMKFVNNTAEGNVAFTEDDWNNFQYGTITLPSNLRLIERFAFAGSNSVTDVYVLNPIAPECHVDAFNTVMYVGNNTLDKSYIKDGVVTREAYRVSDYGFVSILHYPRETTDPHIQRYTDPTREYSIATGDRDGNGSTLYYPNHSEMTFAYYQGSYGYLWKGWNDSRNWYDQSLTAGYGNGLPSVGPSHKKGDKNYQDVANQRWTDNPADVSDKADRTFYDVTTGANNQFNETTAPEGITPYYQNQYAGMYLYPKAKSVQSNYYYIRDDRGDYVKDPEDANLFRAYTAADDAKNLERYSRKQTLETDEDGNIKYTEDPDGDYVQNFQWDESDEGEYIKEMVSDGFTQTNVLVDDVDTYYSDAEGTTAVTPQLSAAMYYACGTADDYTLIDTNKEQPGDRSAYYTTSDGGQTHTSTNLPFSKTLYIDTKETKPKYSSTNKLKYGVAHYYDASGEEVTPLLKYNNPTSGTIYYLDSENVRHNVTDMTFVRGEGKYYFEFSYGGSSAVSDSYPVVDLDGTYYYEDGTEPIYDEALYFVNGTTYYRYDEGSASYVEQSIGWNEIQNAYNGVYYYVSGSHTAYCSAEGMNYDASETYYSDNTGTEATTIRFNTNYFIPKYVESYRLAQSSDDDGKQHYSRTPLGTYRLATAADVDEQHYKTTGVDVVASSPITYTVAYDYRGWHQFILSGRGYNKIDPMEPIRSFITDNDWWTICEPYDLRYSDMIKFYGTEDGKKIPYLSKLMYVVRDVENQKITLMFSKNLMVYKEQFDDVNTQSGKTTANRVHGTIDDETMWPATNDAGKKLGEEGYDPVILHAGVPYLIKPNLTFKDGKANRQFDIYKSENEDLYNRLKESQEMPGSDQMELVHNGIYTVPAYVVGYDAENAASESTIDGGTLKIEMKDGTTITYQDSEKSGKKLTYKGKEVDYKISSDFKYSFVGSFYKGVMPQYSYFLGWDSNNNCAAFWYSRVQDKTGWNWNNETGIICPNFTNLAPESQLIHQATGVEDPARWTLVSKEGVSSLKTDDFVVGGGGGAKGYTMDFGATNYFEVIAEIEGIATDINNVSAENDTLSVYSINGVNMGTSLKGLAKGLYIVNGKKYVVK